MIISVWWLTNNLFLDDTRKIRGPDSSVDLSGACSVFYKNQMLFIGTDSKLKTLKRKIQGDQLTIIWLFQGYVFGESFEVAPVLRSLTLTN